MHRKYLEFVEVEAAAFGIVGEGGAARYDLTHELQAVALRTHIHTRTHTHTYTDVRTRLGRTVGRTLRMAEGVNRPVALSVYRPL